jgi:hypothetical protein
MSKGAKQESREEFCEPSAVMERLNWQLAWRDDGRVAQALYEGEEIEEMHERSRGGAAGRVFCVPGASGNDGRLRAVGTAWGATGAGAGGAVCAAVLAQSARWGRVDECVAALARKSTWR